MAGERAGEPGPLQFFRNRRKLKIFGILLLVKIKVSNFLRKIIVYKAILVYQQ